MIGCKLCGLCCKYIAIAQPMRNVSREEKRWMDLHKWKIIPRGANLMIFVPSKCVNLSHKNRCKDYENRPQACRELPSPGITAFQPPGCRYYEDK